MCDVVRDRAADRTLPARLGRSGAAATDLAGTARGEEQA